MANRIDLHTHTTFSDGTLSPTALVKLAHQQQINVLAITDHDTTDGLPEAMEASQNTPLEIIPGTELSTIFQGREIHILGYFINLSDPQFQTRLKELSSTRIQRIQHILAQLQLFDIDISLSEITQVAGTGTIGRPHIAQVLIEKGYVTGFKEAFERYLGLRGKAYVPRVVPEAHEVISWITEAGGIPVLAHPFWEGLNKEESINTCRLLMEQGLRGLEVFYGTFSERQISFNLNLARQFNLLITGGSDFHGHFKPHISLGKGQGSLKVPPTILDHLRLAAGF